MVRTCKLCGGKYYAKGFCKKHYKKEYSQRPEVKAKVKEYLQRPEVKAKVKEYLQRPEVKAKQKEYQQRPEVKERIKKWTREKRPFICSNYVNAFEKGWKTQWMRMKEPLKAMAELFADTVDTELSPKNKCELVEKCIERVSKTRKNVDGEASA